MAKKKVAEGKGFYILCIRTAVPHWWQCYEVWKWVSPIDSSGKSLLKPKKYKRNYYLKFCSWFTKRTHLVSPKYTKTYIKNSEASCCVFVTYLFVIQKKITIMILLDDLLEKGNGSLVVLKLQDLLVINPFLEEYHTSIPIQRKIK